MNSWGQRMSVDLRAVKFLFEGNALRGNSTPEQLGMCHNIAGVYSYCMNER